MDQVALLHRLNPDDWPTWSKDIPRTKYAVTYFETGRRRPERIHPGIPVVVLGTQGLGIVAVGETASHVQDLLDPDANLAPPTRRRRYSDVRRRVRVRVMQVRVSIAKVQAHPVTADLPRFRRETTTWLNKSQYDALISLVREYGK